MGHVMAAVLLLLLRSSSVLDAPSVLRGLSIKTPFEIVTMKGTRFKRIFRGRNFSVQEKKKRNDTLSM